MALSLFLHSLTLALLVLLSHLQPRLPITDTGSGQSEPIPLAAPFSAPLETPERNVSALAPPAGNLKYPQDKAQVESRIEAPATPDEDIPRLGDQISSDDVKLASLQLELVDPAAQIEAVLNKHHGYVAFSFSVEEGRLESVFAAPNWRREPIIGPYVPAEKYCSFTMRGYWPLLARIAAEEGIAHISWSYIAFDRTMCARIRDMIREVAGRNGIGCARHARLRFDSGGAGFSVVAIKPCEAEAGAGAVKANR